MLCLFYHNKNETKQSTLQTGVQLNRVLETAVRRAPNLPPSRKAGLQMG